MQIERIVKEDVLELERIEKEVFVNDSWTKEEIEAIIFNNPNNSFYYKIIENNRIIGYSGFRNYGEIIEIETLGILKEYQNKGYGNILFSYILNRIKEQGIRIVTLHVRVSNEIAIKMYQKYDFKIFNVAKNYYSNEDGYLMIRIL